MKDQLILRVMAKLILPFILLFALYVQFHGDYGPGGGFQAGVIFGAAIILYVLIFGREAALRAIRPGVVEAFAALGLLLFAGTGVAALLMGGTYLDYNVFLKDPGAAQHLGIFLVELGVGITVAAVMISVFFAFVSFGKDDTTGEL